MFIKIKSINFPLLFIFLIALFWRFYDYPHRWVLNQDQARDTIIALYAINTHQLPLLGSTSSAGPFNFGALYDWLVIAVTFLFPFASGPWVAFTLLTFLIVPIFYFIGKTIADPRLGLIAAFIAAISFQPINNAPDMLNTVIIILPLSLAFLFLAKLIKTSHIRYAYWLAFSVGLALNCHFQALGTLSLLLSVFLINRYTLKKRLTMGVLMTLGFTTTFLPNIYFDLTHRFVWIQSVVAYYTSGVNKFHAPIRWLTEIRDFWPQLWGDVILGIPNLGYGFIALFIFALYLGYKKHRLSSTFIIILVSFLIEVLLLRYYKGTRSREYFIAFHPFFIFFTAWIIYLFSLVSKYIFWLLIATLLIVSTISNLTLIRQQSQVSLIFNLKSDLDKYSSGPFSISAPTDSNMLSLPIFYLLYRQHRLDSQGTPLGICIHCVPPTDKLISKHAFNPNQKYSIYDLSTATPSADFHLLTPSLIYSWLYVNYD